MARMAIVVVAAALAAGPVAAADAPAQARRGYDPAKAETVRGEVVSVDRTVPRPDGGTGVHVQLRTEDGPLTVRLGPAWWIDEQKLALAKGDTIEVRGSRVAGAEPPALVAATVRKGERVVKLRDETGAPAWRGRGGRGRGAGR